MDGAADRIGIIGAGRLGAMLARAFARFRPGETLHLATRDAGVAAALATALPPVRLLAARELAGACDLVLLAIPPQTYRAVIRAIAPDLRPGAILVSLTNGIGLEALAHETTAPIVKVIPTMAHAEGRGIALVIAGPGAAPAHVERVRACFSAIATPVVIADADSRAASNIAGSALAFVARFAEGLVDAHTERLTGIAPAALTAMMAETLIAVGTLAQAGHSFADIVATTATPGGVTEAGLAVLDAPLPALAATMVDATYARQRAMQTQQT